MQKISCPCLFEGGKEQKFDFYIGEPSKASPNPIYHQLIWLEKNRGGSLSRSVSESLKKVQKIAEKNGKSVAILTAYTLSNPSTNPENAPVDVPTVYLDENKLHVFNCLDMSGKKMPSLCGAIASACITGDSEQSQILRNLLTGVLLLAGLRQDKGLSYLKNFLENKVETSMYNLAVLLDVYGSELAEALVAELRMFLLAPTPAQKKNIAEIEKAISSWSIAEPTEEEKRMFSILGNIETPQILKLKDAFKACCSNENG